MTPRRTPKNQLADGWHVDELTELGTVQFVSPRRTGDPVTTSPTQHRVEALEARVAASVAHETAADERLRALEREVANLVRANATIVVLAGQLDQLRTALAMAGGAFSCPPCATPTTRRQRSRHAASRTGARQRLGHALHRSAPHATRRQPGACRAVCPLSAARVEHRRSVRFLRPAALVRSAALILADWVILSPLPSSAYGARWC
jgi:hypothetical protein